MEREILQVERDVASYQSLKNIASVPRYVIDLDQPPETRWNQLADDYKGNSFAQKDRAEYESDLQNKIYSPNTHFYLFKINSKN